MVKLFRMVGPCCPIRFEGARHCTLLQDHLVDDDSSNQFKLITTQGNCTSQNSLAINSEHAMYFNLTTGALIHQRRQGNHQYGVHPVASIVLLLSFPKIPAPIM